ncbi:deoxyguanosinetriphosphate triphosphohydrolase [Nocardioides sp. TRM66260-LWL]|uniref:deoxyguanosinetriphosphate triphosphohydrolase n=1 Tax=Nocardioides sp. TRM66260-LWL TaxID=2874478 RepID=UPI001CC7EB4E|nr:deoxyguanosinetriphosphate triphosphohydrolase [Nocardioides sp. TRM66260-LWL]MBZ5735839.1 deoxyguanosinetriphosphate triphosphohydrolase [Nocardioides sp. TRM66260-LWL]
MPAPTPLHEEPPALEPGYAPADAERLVPEPPKRVDAPVRRPFERDRARVVHAAASRRLAAKTQVVGPHSDDFVRNRLTHSLEVAQVARDLSRALGCSPDIAETAALAHDLGHPPFGHNGERLLDSVGAVCGGFEGNAQTLRLLTRLEAKTVDAEGRSVGLNLTRATLDACTKYPWPRGGSGPTAVKFGVYADDRPVFDWLRAGAPAPDAGERPRRCVEAQVMDLADDVAYSVHDVEDGVVAGRLRLDALDAPAVWATLRAWGLADADDAELDDVLAGLRRVDGWPTAAHDGSRRSLAGLKNLTSDLIGRFCGAVQAATFAAADGGPLVRHRADLVVPGRTLLEIAVLKAIAAHYVMQASDRLVAMERQRELLAELVEVLLERGPDALDPPFADDWRAAPDDAACVRVVLDQVASLTDVTAVSWHDRLRRRSA